MITLKKISSQETLNIRRDVLRTGQPVERCIFKGDDLPATQHFGVFVNEIHAGIISVFEAENALFKETPQLQVRGMAILPPYQKEGLGNLLLSEAEAYARKQNYKLLWCNARENALGFYTKNGFTITGEPFMIEGVGVHSVMHKTL